MRIADVSHGLSSGGGRYHFSWGDILQLRVLVLENIQPPGLRHVEAAILRLPLVKGRPADPALAANIRRPGPASCSRMIAMICSSVNLDRLVAPLLQLTNSTQIWRKFRGSDQLA